MGESQAVGVEHEASSSSGYRADPHDWMAMVREVDTDLVGATCLELAVDQNWCV